MKKVISMLAALCLAAAPVCGAQVEKAEDAEITMKAVCYSDDVEVGDQFLVQVVIDGDYSGYLTYSVSGSFDKDVAELIAPVYKDDGFSIVWNEFSNEDGKFQFDAADIAKIKGTAENPVLSLLFKAKKEGRFSLVLGRPEDKKEIVMGRTKAVDGSYSYDVYAEGMELEIVSDSDGENAVIIAEKEQKTPYDDMFGYEWAEVAVGALSRLGILDSIGGESFEPDKSITRGEFTAMLVRGAKLSGEGGQFPDVSEDHPFAKEISAAKKKGIAMGDENGNFNPDANITRQDISALVCRTLKLLGKIQPAEASVLEPFRDGGDISDYAVDTMAAVVRAKLIKGDDRERLNPKKNMTRAEAAVLIERVMVHIKLVK